MELNVFEQHQKYSGPAHLSSFTLRWWLWRLWSISGPQRRRLLRTWTQDPGRQQQLEQATKAARRTLFPWRLFLFAATTTTLVDSVDGRGSSPWWLFGRCCSSRRSCSSSCCCCCRSALGQLLPAVPVLLQLLLGQVL